MTRANENEAKARRGSNLSERAVRTGTRPSVATGSSRSSTRVELETPSPATETIRFGGVTLVGEPPDPEIVAGNIAASGEALQRLAAALVRPGIELPRRPGVPYFWMNNDSPPAMIRELDGKQERVAFIGGEFIVTK